MSTEPGHVVDVGTVPEAGRFGMDICSMVMYGLQQSPSEGSGIWNGIWNGEANIRIRSMSTIKYDALRGVQIVIGVIVERGMLGFVWNTIVDWDSVEGEQESDPDLFKRLLSSIIIAEIRAHWIKRAYDEVGDSESAEQHHNNIRHAHGWVVLNPDASEGPWRVL